MEKIYKPEIGWVFWAHLILILLVITPLLTVWALMRNTGGIPIPIIVVLLIVVMISLLVVARTLYTMGIEKLTVSGAFKKREILYKEVTKIVSTNKGLEFGEGMLVLSPDRILIFCGEKSKTSISPKDKPDALKCLRSKCPNAVFEDEVGGAGPNKEKEATKKT
jgi:hypothetical protein